MTELKAEEHKDIVGNKDIKTYSGIKASKKLICAVIITIIVLLSILGIKIFNKMFYKSTGLPDKKYYKNVVEFYYPHSWIPLGKVFYNPKSIPNLLTYFVATVDPKNIVECQFFSTQTETDNGEEYYFTKKVPKIIPEEYISVAIAKMSPTAKDVRLIKSYKPTYLELKKAKRDKRVFSSVYSDSNPGNTKGSSGLENLTYLPFHYLYEYVEDGKNILHLMEGRLVFFNQYYAKAYNSDKQYVTSVKFVKCEDVFSYKAEKSLFNKNYAVYKFFKKNLKKNKEWEELALAERQQILANLPSETTATLDGGEKFDMEAFKNTVYNIEYPDKITQTMFDYNYGKDLKSFLLKWF